MTMTPADRPWSRFAPALELACVYGVGWLLPFGANLILGLLPADASRLYAPHPLAWLAVWVMSVGVAAYLVARFARWRVGASAFAAALGGLSALVAPFLVYGLPWRLILGLWPELALLGLALPFSIALIARHRWPARI
jgi:hypothetical protein